jgi:aryl-alcohol dehydrogenase-like predicted oxidoreductase
MRYQTFGRQTGLRVSEYALGTANFGTAGAGIEASRQIFDAYVEAGGTTFDSSNIYQGGEAETMLGGLLGRERDNYVLITKYSGTRLSDPRPGTTGNGRKVMMQSLEASLRRLNTDYIDVFMPHFPDGTTPVAEILAGFDDLVRSGKIRHGALSNFPAWRVAGAAVQRSAVVDVVLSIAAEIGASAVGVSLAWLRRRARLAKTSLIPIVGPRTPAHLAQYLQSLQVELDDEQYRQLDEVSMIAPGTPHADVAAALRHGFDGDRSLLDEVPVPVV